uniref:Carbohydrate sulfotransferase n=1 Tax=Rhodnius prolixus TaxID=13249 RepID=T1HA88_RHOPR
MKLSEEQSVYSIMGHILKQMEAFRENKARIRKIAEVCRKYKLGNYKHVNTNTSSTFTIKYPPTPQYSVFYYDLEDSFAFCPIYKAASSTWLYNLCLLAGESEESLQNTKQQLSSVARRFFPEIIDFEVAQEVLEKCTKLIVVRHPFERILSAYRDKLENINTGWEHGTGHFYRKYGAKIVRKYRPGGNKSVAVLKPGSYIWEKKKPRPAGIEPTFKEFVSYLLDTDLLNYADDHWIPYNLFCTPCFVNYDFVAKVETLGRDQLFIINKLGWIKRIQPRWRHKTGEENSKEFIARAYFSQLSQQEVKLLYDKYRLDFEMFDYSPNLYISYAKDDT